MEKGVSAVIAVVTLIAIAVVASVGLWYWSAVYTNKPYSGQELGVSLSYGRCNGSHVFIKNLGTVTAKKNANLFNSSGQYIGYLNFSGNPLSMGIAAYIQIVNTTVTGMPIKGTLDVLDQSYPSSSFSC